MTAFDLTSATKMSLKLFSPQNLRYSTINNSCSPRPARDHCGTAAVTHRERNVNMGQTINSNSKSIHPYLLNQTEGIMIAPLARKFSPTTADPSSRSPRNHIKVNLKRESYLNTDLDNTFVPSQQIVN
jgi:hypothetical protein